MNDIPAHATDHLVFHGLIQQISMVPNLVAPQRRYHTAAPAPPRFEPVPSPLPFSFSLPSPLPVLSPVETLTKPRLASPPPPSLPSPPEAVPSSSCDGPSSYHRSSQERKKKTTAKREDQEKRERKRGVVRLCYARNRIPSGPI